MDPNGTGEERAGSAAGRTSGWGGGRWSTPEQCRWKETARGDPSAVTGRSLGRSGEPIIFHLS